MFKLQLLYKDSRVEGLFKRSSRTLLRQYILESLKKGHKLQIPKTPNTAKECAAALQMFLMQLKEPVMPQRIQRLLLGITFFIIISMNFPVF